MMFSVAPIWDGNETWLILGGAGLFCVFSVAYAILMPALYIPMLIMLIALIFRGIAFEFRFKADSSRRIWDYAFHYGSLLATFAQGVVLGAFVQGFKVQGNQFAGGTWDWLTPFSLATGVGLVCGYGLLGATWCVMKTTGELEIWARRKAFQFLIATIVMMGIISAWVPFIGRQIEARWFSWPNILFLAPVPLLTAFVAYRIYRTLEDGYATAPFLLSIVLFLLGFLGLVISLFPYIVPPSMMVWQAANTVLARKCLRWSATPSPCRSPSRTRPTPITCSAAKSPRRSQAAGTADAGTAALPARIEPRLLHTPEGGSASCPARRYNRREDFLILSAECRMEGEHPQQ